MTGRMAAMTSRTATYIAPRQIDRTPSDIIGPVDRRLFLAGALGATASACASRQPLVSPVVSAPGALIGDAHVHLFNGADLPVGGFFRDVLVPAQLADWPELALAFFDIALADLKVIAWSATDELAHMSAALAGSGDVTATEFANKVADRAEEQMRSANRLLAARNPRENVGDSYAALSELIALHGRHRAGLAPMTVEDFRRGEGAGPLQVDRQALAEIAEKGAESPGANIATGSELLGRSVAELWAILRWVFQMAQSRSSHVRQYLSSMTTRGAQPSLLINLLVDYDLWLDDHPKPGSEQPEQIRFWTAYAKRHANEVRIETFAGFDPLKHAVETRRGATPYFDSLKSFALAERKAEQRIAGFKLYPPMGFSVCANEPLTATGRAADNVRALFRANGWAIADLPQMLDRSLDDLFAFTTKYDVPLLAHGRNSNESYLGAGLKAHPKYWLERAQHLQPEPGRFPLRACIAHFGPEFDADQTVQRILLLNQQGRANIYFDIAYDDQILDPRKADLLLAQIEGICTKVPGSTDYFMFGSDWIMLAQLPHADQYLQAFDEAVARSAFWGSRRSALLGGNLRRFLKLDASSAAPLGS